MEDESNWWHGIIQFRIEHHSECGAVGFNDRHYYFMEDEKPLYDLLRTSKMENIEVRGAYWNKDPTTQKDLSKMVPEPGLLDPIDLGELTKRLERHVVKGLSIGSNK